MPTAEKFVALSYSSYMRIYTYQEWWSSFTGKWNYKECIQIKKIMR